MKESFKDIPAEVWQVQMLQIHKTLVSPATYKECLRIIEKYPECFPWEAKYRSIPKDVHDAYIKECMNEWMRPFIETQVGPYPKFNDRTFKSMVSVGAQKRENYESLDAVQEFKNFFENMNEQEEKRAKQEREARELWDKHYKKYGLNYRP